MDDPIKSTRKYEGPILFKSSLALLLLLMTPLLSCGETSTEDNNKNTPITSGCLDKDKDGYDGQSSDCLLGDDCDDTSSTISPIAKEICGDLVDNNCNNMIDEDCSTPDGCVDADEDGYGIGTECLGPDCDDTNSAINPSADDTCGNKIAENCKKDLPCSKECIDNDGDRFGVGPGCFANDCDDTEPRINPRAKDICGNGIKENCVQDFPCPLNCADADGDGYGVNGAADCPKPELDCNDADYEVHPGAKEICNNKDDNCNETGNGKGIDECFGDGQECVSGECKGPTGSECENNDQCSDPEDQCDSTTTPKQCRTKKDGYCIYDHECVTGLTCALSNKCVGSFCDTNTCSGINGFCDRSQSACVQCDAQDRSVGDAQCGSNVCAPGGWCGGESAFPYSNWPDLRTVNVDLAVCWNTSIGQGKKRLCWVYTSDNTLITITKARARLAWSNGTYESEYSPNQISALDEIWGAGIFDLEDVEWKQNLIPNMDREICLWFQPGIDDVLVLDLCSNYSP